MKRQVLIVVVMMVAWVSLAGRAEASYARSDAPLRLCTNLSDTSCQVVLTTIPSSTTLTMRCWEDSSWYAGTNRWFWVSGGALQGYVSANHVGSQSTVGACNNDPQVKAARWAARNLNDNVYAGWCQLFVKDSWLNGAGKDIGSGGTALNYWNTNPRSYPRFYDTKPPVGAAVYWKWGSDGHAALSIGSGWVISTKEGGTSQIHVFKIANKMTSYAGYLKI